MGERIWWQKPRLRTDEPGSSPRRVTWLELFYDVVFVILIGQIAHRLAGDVSWTGVWQFVFLFIPAWWVWAAGTYYVEYWETDDVSVRAVMFMLMLPVVGMAVFMHDALGDGAREYALTYALARLVLSGLFFRVGVHSRISRTIAWSYAVSFFVVAGLVSASVLAPHMRPVLWGLALLVELAMPLAVSASVRELLPHRREISKLPERFGLFTIIVLGETVVGVFQGLSATHHRTPGILITGALGLVMAFALWSIYFDFVARRHVRGGIWWEFAWGYAHLVLLMCVAAAGASMTSVVTSGDTTPAASVIWLLTGAVALGLVMVGLIELTLQVDDAARREQSASVAIKMGIAGGALVTGLAGGALGSIGVLAILLVLLAVPIVLGVRARVRERSGEAPAEAAGAS